MIPERRANTLAITGIVLAGGQSTRFGDAHVNKAVASFEDRTLLEWVLSAVDEGTDYPPVIAVRTPAQQRTYENVLDGQDVVFARDVLSFEGPLAGVIGAIRQVDSPWVFVCSCDMPLLSADVIRWLRSNLEQIESTSVDALAIAHPDGTIEPMHTLYRRDSILEVLEQIPSDSGIRAVLSALDTVRTLPTTEGPEGISLEDSLTNVNTRTELAAIGPAEK